MSATTNFSADPAVEPAWLSPDIQSQVQAHALDEFPNEAVGVVRDEKYIPLINTAADPLRSFRIDDYPAGAEALIHSHTQTTSTAPSAHDMASQQATGLPWAITACNGVSCTPLDWFGDQAPIAPYLGRTFLSGVRDCWCLIRDIYRREQRIVLPNLPRDEDWYEHDIDLLSPENIASAGFRRIQFDEMRPGYVCLGMLASRIVNHCGLYLGRGLILHHMINRLSCREPVGPWERSIRYFLRHESLFEPGAEWNLRL